MTEALDRLLEHAGMSYDYDADEDDGTAPLFIGEIGRVDGFSWVIAAAPAAFDVEASIPRPITYGPQRKGRGGKIRRW